MPLRLKSRTQCPPNGFFYHQKETGWELNTWDFSELCRQLQAHRRMNPQFKLNTDLRAIEVEVDEANALRVAAIPNAEGYVLNVGISLAPKTPLPQSKPPGQSAGLVGAAVKIKGGLQLLYDWLGSGGKPVPRDHAETRASVCVSCDYNDRGDLSSFFTVPVSEAIRRTLELKNNLKIETGYDDGLRVCNRCLCPLKLKVHVPISFIKEHTDAATSASLPDYCWIKKELQ